jgi:hypothetical protein
LLILYVRLVDVAVQTASWSASAAMIGSASGLDTLVGMAVVEIEEVLDLQPAAITSNSGTTVATLPRRLQTFLMEASVSPLSVTVARL